jgi:hypothetical protein
VAFLDALTIEVESIVGDADLVISTQALLPRIDGSPAQDPTLQMSQEQTQRFESITLYKSENFTLRRPIYIGVYAASMAVYELRFSPRYSLEYQAKLSQFTPLNESQPFPKTFY